MSSFAPLSRRFAVSCALALAVITAVMFGGRIKAEVESSVFFATTLTATKTDALVPTGNNGDGRADPGDTINYTVQVNSTGADPATGVTFSDTIDANTTLQGAFTAASAVAVNDTFPTTVLGNVSINSATITGGPYSVVTNDFLGVNPLSTISAFDAVSANGGNVVMTTSGVAMGQFTYDPPAGFEGTDTFTYTLSDNASATSVVANRTATVSITISGMVWFINNNAPACIVAGCGRLSNPFSTLAAFNTLNNGSGNNPAAGDNIFVYESATTYTGGVTLLANQRFIGQDSQASLSSITGLSPPVGSPAFPAMNLAGSATTITNTTAGGNGITLNDANTVRGFTVSGANSSGIAGVAATNSAIIAGNNDVTITGTNGVAVGDGALSFNGGNGAITFSGIIAGNSSDAVNIRNRTGGITTIQGSVTSNTRGVVLDNNDGATILFTAGLSLSTGPNAAFTAINGGTVNATQNNTSIINTLTTTTGTALNVANTTIGANNLEFRSISSSGGSANGIILNTTGSSGGLKVVGDGTNTSVGGNSSGGTIANKTGADLSFATLGCGIYLNNTSNVVLRRMTINGTNQNYGIRGTLVNGFTLEYSTVGGTNGTNFNTAPYNAGEGSIYFGDTATNGLSGTATLTSNNISGGHWENFRIITTQASPNVLTLSVKGNTFGANLTTVEANASMTVENRGTGTINTTLGGTVAGEPNTFTAAAANLVNFTGQTASTMDVVMRNNVMSNNHPGNIIGGCSLTLATQGAMTFHVTGNTMRDANGSAVTLQKASAGTSLSGFFDSNTIGVAGVADSGSKTGNGLFFSYAGAGTGSVTATNNAIHQIKGNFHISADNTGGSYQANFDIRGNTFDTPGSGNAGAIGMTNGSPGSGDTVNVSAVIGGSGGDKNTISGYAAAAQTIFLGSDGAGAGHTFNLPGLSPAGTEAGVQNFVAANNTMNGTVVDAFADAPATFAAFTGTGTNCGTPASRPADLDGLISEPTDNIAETVTDATPIPAELRDMPKPEYMTPLARRLYLERHGVPYQDPPLQSMLQLGNEFTNGSSKSSIAIPSGQTAILDTAYQQPLVEINGLIARYELYNGSSAAITLNGAGGSAKVESNGIFGSISEFANSLVSMIMPTASAQEVRVINGAKVRAPESGETVNVGPINTLPAGKSVTITFRVLVDTLDSGEIRSRILNQGSADSNETSPVLTTDPSPSVDPACTALPSIGTKTCTPVDRPDAAIVSIARSSGFNPTNNDDVQWTIMFSQPVAGVDQPNFNYVTTGGVTATWGGATPQGGTPSVEWSIGASTIAGDGTIDLRMINDGGLSHDITTALPYVQPANAATFTIDNTPPSTTSFVRQTPATNPTNADVLVFRATFSEAVTEIAANDFAVTGTTATITDFDGVGGGPNFTQYDIQVSGGDLAGLNGVVGLNFVPAPPAGFIKDLAGNFLPNTEPGTDETYTLDNAPPTVTINQAGGQVDPTNTSPISFTVAFNEAVTDFDDLADVTLTGTATATVTSITPAGGNTFTVVVTPTTNGTVIANIGSGVAIDGAGNPNGIATFTDNQVTYDTAGPTVTINQAVGQSDPTFANPINFTVIFNEPVTDFDDSADVVVTGSAAGVGTATKVITPNSTTNYTVAISGITGDGTVIANVPAGVAIDAATNSNAIGTFTDNTVTFVTCVPPPPNMIGWWAWDGNGADIANGNTATLVGSPTFPAGKVNQAIQLDGSTQFANTTSVINAGAAGAFTVDAWINPNNVTTAQPLVEWNNNTGGGPGQGIGVHFWLAVAQAGGGPGSLYANVRQNSFDHPVSSAQNLVVPGQWQHVAMSYDGANFGKTRLYLNGVIVADVNVSAFTPDTNMRLYFGRRPAPAAFSFGGGMDEVEVFNRALTPAEIQSIFAADGGGKCKPSDLRVDKSHVGNFTQGTAGSYSVVVSNDGPAATSGTTTMTDTLPAGLTPGAATGSGWACNTATQTVTCTSTAAIAAAGTFPTLTIPVTPTQNSALSLNNTATVSGGGEMDTSDDSDTDPTTIVGVAQTPSVTNAATVHGAQTTSGLVITPNATDGSEVTHFKITNIQNGTLFQNDGTTPITAGSFITVAQGGAGLKFTPNLGFVGNATFDIQASISNSDPGLGGSVITATIVVSKANTLTTITSDNPEPSVFGGNVVVNFTVVPVAPGMGVPTGNVVVTVSGGAETCTGTSASGTCTLALTAIGARTLTATYAGDTFFNGSVDTEAHQVDQAATTTTITTDNPDPSVTGEQVTVVFTVTANGPGAGTPTGNVNVTVSGGAETCTGTVASGNCIITLNSVGAPRTLTATYVGDTNFTGSSDTETHQVNQAATTTTTVTDTPDASVVGQPVAVTFTVIATPPGSGTPTGNVVVTISGGAETCTGTVASGTCNITLTSAGARTLTATYSGDSNFLTSNDTEPHQVSQASTTITGITDAPDPSNIDQPYTVGFTLNVTAPGAGTPTGTVSVNDGTGDACTATLPATSCQLQSLTQGVKTITVTYNGDANFATSNNTAGHLVNCTPNPVVTNNNNSGTGSLRKAVADACAAVGQNTITFAAGPIPNGEEASPEITSPISLSGGQITIGTNLIIQGPGASLLTVQNTAAASPTSRVFSVNVGVTATVSGLTITGGNTSTANGGAINNDGTLTLTNTVITGNNAGSTTSFGGGGIASQGTLNLNSSTVSNNTAMGGGGGLLMINGGTTNITASTFSGNTGNSSGAILAQSFPVGSGGLAGILTVTNSTISGNTAIPTTPCGGIWVLGALSTANITSTTITNNTGTFAGGVCSSGGTATVRNSIIAGNVNNTTVPDVNGAFISQGFNLIGNRDTSAGFIQPTDQTGTGAAPINPQIGVLANNGGLTQTHALLTSSPAVDKGDDGSVPPTTDQRGELRPFDLPSIAPAAGGDNSDIGAYELNTIPTTTTVTSNFNPSVFGQNVTFTATVATVPPGGAVTGNIDFSFDGNPVAACQNVVLAANQATCSTSTLSVGAHTIFAEFDENLPFLASSGTLTQNVNKANTTTAVTASPASPSVFGQSVTFTATVAAAPPGAGTPTGTVTFNIDGNLYCVNTPLNGSQQAACTQAGLPELGAGLRNVVAIYNGDANFNGSSGTLNYTVNKADTTIVIPPITGDTPDPSIIGQSYAVTWTTSVTPPGAGTPTGNVTVSDGTGGTCTAPVATGTCNVTSTTMGVKTLVATYAGDANFNGSVSAGVSHTVNLQITGTIRNGLTLAPISAITVNLIQLPSTLITTATTNASGVFTFAGQFTGGVRVIPATVNPPYYDPSYRNYALAGSNITGADFLSYANVVDIPRTITHLTQWVVPGAAGTMPVILNSQNNEASVSYTIIFDINPFATPPTFVCGANPPGCTIVMDTSVLGRVGVTITPAGGSFTRPDGTPLEGQEAAGPKEIAKINFQTLATATMPSTDFTITNSPVNTITLDAANNPLLQVFILPVRVVFAHGIEGDVAGRNAGSGVVDSSDVVQVRRFVTGLDTPVATHNEFQRADAAPATTKGNGILDATDVVQIRRYGTGLDAPQSAGGSGAANPGPIAPPAAEAAVARGGDREIKIGSASASTGSRVSIPVGISSTGDETAISFTLRYDETKLTAPRVDLGKDSPEGVTLTVNTNEPGLINVLLDSTSPFARNSKDPRSLIEITFDVSQNAPSGDTSVAIEDVVISDSNARPLTARLRPGSISIAGPNPPADDKPEKSRRPNTRRVDLIEEWLTPSTLILRPRRDQ